jgi:hypothetical protein
MLPGAHVASGGHIAPRGACVGLKFGLVALIRSRQPYWPLLSHTMAS